jgi:hypothetical protein
VSTPPSRFSWSNNRFRRLRGTSDEKRTSGETRTIFGSGVGAAGNTTTMTTCLGQPSDPPTLLHHALDPKLASGIFRPVPYRPEAQAALSLHEGRRLASTASRQKNKRGSSRSRRTKFSPKHKRSVSACSNRRMRTGAKARRLSRKRSTSRGRRLALVQREPAVALRTANRSGGEKGWTRWRKVLRRGSRPRAKDVRKGLPPADSRTATMKTVPNRRRGLD